MTTVNNRPLPAPGPIAVRAAADAELPANLTVREEGGENRGKYVEIYLAAVGLGPGAPWCGAFVRFRLEKAAGALGRTIPDDFPDSGWTPDYAAWGKKKGLWIPAHEAHRALRGDLACFYFAAKQRIAHIGIVVSALSGNRFITVEGNTGPSGAAGVVEREGDGVYRKSRRTGDLGVYGGFVRLPF